MSEQEKKPEIQYLVWDVAEVMSVCTPAELKLINTIVDRILLKRQEEGTVAVKKYIVVERDKPYSKEVIRLINKYQNQQGRQEGED